MTAYTNDLTYSCTQVSLVGRVLSVRSFAHITARLVRTSYRGAGPVPNAAVEHCADRNSFIQASLHNGVLQGEASASSR